MAKLSLTDLANLSNENTAVAAINANNTSIETALENTLSRDGTSPNTMSAPLDMNSNRIINLPAPVEDNDAVRLVDVVEGITGPTGATGATGAAGTNGTNGTDPWLAATAWLTATAYVVGPPASVVTDNGSTYVCIESHTSGTFATDLAAAKWLVLAQAGSGDVSTNTATSVVDEAVLFADTSGKILKRSTLTGIVKSASGVQSAATAGTDYYNPGGTDVAVADGGTGASTAAGALTNLSAAGQGKQTIFIPATAMVPRVTNGAASGSVEQTTNKNMVKSLDFDTTTQEFAQFSVAFPKSWNLGTVTFAPHFSQLTTAAGNVVFGLAGVAVSSTDALDVAFGTAQTSDTTAGTANLEYVGPESSAITIAGTPAANDRVMFQINRTVASDSLAQDARLHGIRLFFTTNAATDA